jgi:hypothetical protein
MTIRHQMKSMPKKSRGRPPTTGKGIQVRERWQAEEQTAIDTWIDATGASMTRGQAIRRLVEIGLHAGASVEDVRSQNKASDYATMASELAEELGLKAKK